MHKQVALIALPKQDLIRPPAALPILAAACEELDVEYEANDLNLWLYRNIPLDTWNLINDNWETVDPFESYNENYYQVFLTKLKEFVDHVLRPQPDLIAISVFSLVSVHCAYELIVELNRRESRSKFKITIGGSGIRTSLSKLDNEEFCTGMINRGLINCYIFGEGEVAFPLVVQENYNYPGINNFEAVQLDDLNNFPFPSYTKIKPTDYEYVQNPEIMLTGSRGCVRKCTYCDVARYWPKFRYRDGEKIADELYYYYKNYGLKNFEFSDSLINGSLKQFDKMNQVLIQYQEQDPDFKISYKGQYICRPKGVMSEQHYRNMKQAGCDYVYVGVESFSDHVRYDMDKKFKNDDLEFHLKMCGRYGIKNGFLMIVGYPTETLEDHKKNLEMLRKYQPYAQAGVIALITFGYTTSILDDTPLFHLQDQLNIIPDYEEVEGFDRANWVSLDNPSLTLTERIRRWVELTELASELGYTMPRYRHYVVRFLKILEKIKGKKKFYRLTQQKIGN
jgi:radical SAM superfamily enzyme YgiQ (UPF0313 family)